VFDRNEERLEQLGGGIEVSTALDRLDRFDWVVEATGSQFVLSRVLEESRPGATLLLLGLPYAEESFSFESIVAFDKTVVGSVGSASGDFDEALAMLPRLEIRPFLETAFPMEEYEAAWAALREGRSLKIMLDIDPEAE
jgi:threonine dehydrogenase-like Zn-dependent dehydrogenase